MEEMKEMKCNYCKVILPIHKFSKNRAEKYLKSCDECRGKQKKSRDKNKCEHGKQKSECKQCGGSQICEHDKRKSQCKDCEGTSICEHNKQRSQCKNCMNDEQKIDFIQKIMISNSRQKDKKKDRYDANNFIDKPFLEGLFEDSENCHYCSINFTYNEVIDTFVTIERLNNNIGHIKSNCVLACWKCNNSHKDKNDIRT